MPAVQVTARSIFAKLDRQLKKLARKPTPQAVHGFRTSGRRLEVLLGEGASGCNSRKVLKLLSRLRRKAGRVRDLDVQIGLLRALKMPEGARHKSQLLEAFAEERVRRENKFAEALDKDTIRDLRKRLKRSADHTNCTAEEAWGKALRIFAKLNHQNAPLTEKVLHDYRLAGKRVRYLAELSGQNPQAQEMVNRLKDMQDVLGEWHDWLKLTQRAENLLTAAPESPLVAALRNLTHAKFRLAVNVLTDIQAAHSKMSAPELPAARKEPTPSPATRAAAA